MKEPSHYANIANLEILLLVLSIVATIRAYLLLGIREKMIAKTAKHPVIIVKQIGEIIFWHEEIIDLIRSQNISQLFPKTTDKFYISMGFKPTFYSIHILEINGKEFQAIVFTNVNQERVYRHHGIVLSQPLSEYIEHKDRALLDKNLIRHIEHKMVKVFKGEDLFSQTAVSIKLFEQRLEMLKKIDI